jgi:hypothetical protein
MMEDLAAAVQRVGFLARNIYVAADVVATQWSGASGEFAVFRNCASGRWNADMSRDEKFVVARLPARAISRRTLHARLMNRGVALPVTTVIVRAGDESALRCHLDSIIDDEGTEPGRARAQVESLHPAVPTVLSRQGGFACALATRSSVDSSLFEFSLVFARADVAAPDGSTCTSSGVQVPKAGC